MFKWLKLSIIMILTISGLYYFQPPTSALACSGQPSSIETLIEHSDTIVYASLVEQDDAGQNGIWQVQEVLYGTSVNSTILLSINDPATVDGLLDGVYGGGDCQYIHGHMPTDGAYYLFLRRQVDGRFKTVADVFEPIYYQFPMTVPTGGRYLGDDTTVQHMMPETEFRQMVAESTKQTPIPPMSTGTYTYALKAPLIIETDKGIHYQLPADYQVLTPYASSWPNYQSCAVLPGCRSATANGYYQGELVIDQDSGKIMVSFREGYRTRLIEGQGFVLSPLNNNITVWNENTLTIYEPAGFQDMAVVNQVTLEFELTLVGQGVYSHDAQQFAYTDAAGLWVWNIHPENSQPELLIATDDTEIYPVPRYFSSQNQFLMVEYGVETFNLELATGNRYPAGVFNETDEHILTQLSPENALAICPDKANCVTLDNTTQFTWRNETQFYATLCDENLTVCRVEEIAIMPDMPILIETLTTYDGDYFAYDVMNDSLAIIQNDSQVWLNGTVYDWSEEIDGTITSLSWGTSYFYHVTPAHCEMRTFPTSWSICQD